MRALAKKNDAAVLSAIEEKRHNDIYAHAVEVLRTRATNDEIKKMLLESSQKLTSYRKQITDIQSKLAAALVEAQKAGAFQEKLQLLRNVLSVAQFVAQAQAEIPGAGVIDGDNLLTIDRKVSEYRKEQDGIILRRREQMSVQIQLTNEEAAKLRPLLQQSGAPREIIDWTL